MVNWVWFQVGGDWTYVDNVRKLYQGKGHNVIPFAMKSEQDFDSYGYDKYFEVYIMPQGSSSYSASGAPYSSMSSGPAFCWIGICWRDLTRAMSCERAST